MLCYNFVSYQGIKEKLIVLRFSKINGWIDKFRNKGHLIRFLKHKKKTYADYDDDDDDDDNPEWSKIEVLSKF